MTAAQSSERRGGGAEHADVALRVRVVERASKLRRCRLHARQFLAVYEERRERDERRVAQILAVAYLFVEEGFVVLRAGVSLSVVVRVISLNQHAPGKSPATGAARDLCDELERPDRKS